MRRLERRAEFAVPGAVAAVERLQPHFLPTWTPEGVAVPPGGQDHLAGWCVETSFLELVLQQLMRGSETLWFSFNKPVN